MKRLARRVSLLVALYLLTAAATAYAECAWVLWGFNSYSSYGQYWAKHDAFDTRKACIDFLDHEQGRGAHSTRLSETHLWVLLENGQGGMLRCLPDTVDPRPLSEQKR